MYSRKGGERGGGTLGIVYSCGQFKPSPAAKPSVSVQATQDVMDA